MKEINFPRDTIAVGECVAVVAKLGSGHTNAGDAIQNCRPKIERNGERWKASRLSYHLNISSIPRTPKNPKEGLVLHSCDNDWCINPAHLRLGTHAENMRDRSDRKRSAAFFGESNPSKRPEIRLKMSDAARSRVGRGPYTVMLTAHGFSVRGEAREFVKAISDALSSMTDRAGLSSAVLIIPHNELNSNGHR